MAQTTRYTRRIWKSVSQSYILPDLWIDGVWIIHVIRAKARSTRFRVFLWKLRQSAISLNKISSTSTKVTPSSTRSSTTFSISSFVANHRRTYNGFPSAAHVWATESLGKDTEWDDRDPYIKSPIVCPFQGVRFSNKLFFIYFGRGARQSSLAATQKTTWGSLTLLQQQKHSSLTLHE